MKREIYVLVNQRSPEASDYETSYAPPPSVDSRAKTAAGHARHRQLAEGCGSPIGRLRISLGRWWRALHP